MEKRESPRGGFFFYRRVTEAPFSRSLSHQPQIGRKIQPAPISSFWIIRGLICKARDRKADGHSRVIGDACLRLLLLWQEQNRRGNVTLFVSPPPKSRPFTVPTGSDSVSRPTGCISVIPHS